MMIRRKAFTRNYSVYCIKSTKHHMKILLRDFNTKVGGDDIFKPTIGNDSLHEISNDKGLED
jgi:hypothetical protein